jgi:predicted RNase H-like HicB family nuclease
VFPQFHSSIGQGETEEEALKDAAYILAWSVYYTVEEGRTVPEPVDNAEAQKLMEEKTRQRPHKWARVKVQPELVDEELYDVQFIEEVLIGGSLAAYRGSMAYLPSYPMHNI